MNLESVVKNWQLIFASCCSVVILAACSAGGEATPAVQTLSVRDAWARAADSGANTAIYFTLANNGTESDTLTDVASGDAELTEMHVSTQHGGMMRMSRVTALPVPADDSVSFRPLGAHVMLMRVVRPLVEGDTVTTTLSFGSGQTVRVSAGVRRP
jgi:periplasmic copper chaperone A